MTEDIPRTDAGKAREGLIDELKTINHYEEMSAQAEDDDLKRQFDEIVDDEKVHVGNFAEMIADKDKDAEPLMREGLEESRKMRKATFLSFKEMMGGASHFEKAGMNDPDKTAPGVIAENKKRGRKDQPFWFSDKKLRNTGGAFEFDDETVNLGTRNADISLRRYPYSRAQWMEAIALGAAKPLTYEDVVNDPKYYADGKEKDDITYILEPDGKRYLVRLDPDDGKYHQIIRKTDAKGRYEDFYMTPKTTEHYSKYDPQIVTTQSAMKYYDAYKKRMAARNRDGNKGGKRSETYWGTNEWDDFTTEEEKEFGVDMQGDIDSRFARARYKSPEFDDFALVSGVMKMPVNAYMSLSPHTKELLDDLTAYMEGEIFGEESDLSNPAVSTQVRQKIAKDIYENPQKYIGRMSHVMENADDFVELATLNDTGFAKEISRQVKRINRIAKPDEYKAAMNETRKNFKPYHVKDRNGKPMFYSDGSPVIMTISTHDLYNELGKKTTEMRNEILNSSPFPEDRQYHPNAQFTDTELRGIGEGKAVKVDRFGGEKTLNPELVNAAVIGAHEHGAEQKQYEGRTSQPKGSVPIDLNDTNVWGDVRHPPSPNLGPTGKTGAEVETGQPNSKKEKKQSSGKVVDSSGEQRVNADEFSTDRNRAKNQTNKLEKEVNGKKGDKKNGGGNVKKQSPTTPTAKSASFAEMLKSATDEKWKEKGLPAGTMEKTLPAYYRTVTMGCDKDAINVYEHQKMPVGGDGISVKKVPGIGPKMSTKGDE